MSLNIYNPTDSVIVHNAKADFGNKNKISEILHLVQYDHGLPIVAVSLYKDAKEYIIPDEIEEIKIRWFEKISNKQSYDILGINQKRNVVYFRVYKNMTKIHGNFSFIIELLSDIGSDTYRAGSSSVPVIIERNPVQDSEV